MPKKTNTKRALKWLIPSFASEMPKFFSQTHCDENSDHKEEKSRPLHQKA